MIVIIWTLCIILLNGTAIPSSAPGKVPSNRPSNLPSYPRPTAKPTFYPSLSPSTTMPTPLDNVEIIAEGTNNSTNETFGLFTDDQCTHLHEVRLINVTRGRATGHVKTDGTCFDDGNSGGRYLYRVWCVGDFRVYVRKYNDALKCRDEPENKAHIVEVSHSVVFFKVRGSVSFG